MHSSKIAKIGGAAADKRMIFLAIALLGLATFITYLVSGVYYVTGPISPFPALKIAAKGDTFLTAFPGWNKPEEFDAAAYNRAAIEVLRTGIPRDNTGDFFLHAPVYAYFMAACYWIGGLRLLAVAIPQAILAAFTAIAIATSAYRIAGRSRLNVLLIAGLLFLINPRLAMYVGYLSPTILLLFLFSLALLTATRPFTTGSLSLFVISNVLAIATQAGFFLVALGGAGWLIARFFQTRARRLLITAGIVCCFAIGKITPLLFFPATTGGTLNEGSRGVLWEGNNPYYESMSIWSPWERRPGNQWSTWKMSAQEKQRHDAYLERTNQDHARAAWLWIRENPAQFAKLMTVRLWTTLGPFTGMMSPRNRLISFCIWLLILPAGCYGWWLSRRLPVTQFAAVVTLTLLLSSTFVIVEWYLRYRLPIDLLLTVYAAVGYSQWLSGGFKSTDTVLAASFPSPSTTQGLRR